jgi:type IV pilus assembly protein PilM
MMARSTPRVGIDFEQALMAAAQVKGTRQSQVLTHAAVQPLPEGLITEGEVADVNGLAAQLKSFWRQNGFSGRRVNLGVANQKIVVRTMEFPVIDEKELRAAVEFQAQEHIPIPVEEAVLDYQITSSFTGEDGAARQRILLVAAQRDMIRQFVDVARKAGLSVDGIDLQAFALARSLAPTYDVTETAAQPEQPDKPTDGTATALVNIGSGITNLVVVLGETPQFTRVISLGSESFIQAIVNERGVDVPEAWRLATMVGLPGDGSETYPEDVRADAVSSIHSCLENACETFSDEIRRSVDYYHTQAHEGQIGKVLVTGDGSLVRNLSTHLTQSLHLTVEQADPLRHLAENKSKLSAAELEAMAPRLAIAVGLALDEEA